MYIIGKMKILAAADIHGGTRLANALAKKAQKEHVDLVVLCGDLVLSDANASGIIGPFVKKNKKVVLIPGNHETIATADFLAELYGATNLHGYSMQLGEKKELGLFGCGLANIGQFRLQEHEIYDILKKGYNYIKKSKKKIMVTHVHPSGTLMEKLSHFVPSSTGVKKALDVLKPDILLCSHVHEAEGIEEKIGQTTIINVGRKGKIIEV